jgi:hypothetical protein
MAQPESRDLTNISFDDFVSLIFNPAEQIKPDRPLSGIEVEVDAKRLCAYYVQLFQKPEFLLSRFTKQELEEGFWEIMGYTMIGPLATLSNALTHRYPAARNALSPWPSFLNASLPASHWIPLFTCGGILSAIRGTAGIESESEEARTWSCRTPTFRPLPKFWRLIPGFVRVPRSMGWAIFIIPTPPP